MSVCDDPAAEQQGADENTNVGEHPPLCLASADEAHAEAGNQQSQQDSRRSRGDECEAGAAHCNDTEPDKNIECKRGGSSRSKLIELVKFGLVISLVPAAR